MVEMPSGYGSREHTTEKTETPHLYHARLPPLADAYRLFHQNLSTDGRQSASAAALYSKGQRHKTQVVLNGPVVRTGVAISYKPRS